jgi:Arc/MetJ family transcription regulator
MRTNIDIDDELMAQAMAAGPYSTKKDAVEAGLRLLARQAAYREILKWRGKLKWEGDESIDWTQPASAPSPATGPATSRRMAASAPPAVQSQASPPAAAPRRARR